VEVVVSADGGGNPNQNATRELVQSTPISKLNRLRSREDCRGTTVVRERPPERGKSQLSSEGSTGRDVSFNQSGGEGFRPESKKRISPGGPRPREVRKRRERKSSILAVEPD